MSFSIQGGNLKNELGQPYCISLEETPDTNWTFYSTTPYPDPIRVVNFPTLYTSSGGISNFKKITFFINVYSVDSMIEMTVKLGSITFPFLQLSAVGIYMVECYCLSGSVNFLRINSSNLFANNIVTGFIQSPYVSPDTPIYLLTTKVNNNNSVSNVNYLELDNLNFDGDGSFEIPFVILEPYNFYI